MIVFQCPHNYYFKFEIIQSIFPCKFKSCGDTLKVTETTGHFAFTRWFLLSQDI